MGYITRYELEVKNVGTEEVFNRIVSQLNNRKIIGYALDSGMYDAAHKKAEFDCYAGEYVKWYECDNDIIAISKMFPECLFILSGDGEEEPDLWRSYYKNGLTETCYAELVYPEPSEYFRS